MKIVTVIILFFLSISATMAQKTDLPYYEIPTYPDEYTASTVAARMVDGLGFRYYWATEGLRPEDLAFRPNDEARTSEETIDHILGLTNMILNAVKKMPNTGENLVNGLNFEQKRRKTLENIKTASDILKSSTAEDLDDFKIIFKNNSGTSEYPFWNQINGPISDALWHIGQVVSFRRSSGNPFNSNVSVLSGKLRH